MILSIGQQPPSSHYWKSRWFYKEQHNRFICMEVRTLQANKVWWEMKLEYDLQFMSKKTVRSYIIDNITVNMQWILR